MLNETLIKEIIERCKGDSLVTELALWFFDKLQEKTPSCNWKINQRYIALYDNANGKDKIHVDIQTRKKR